MAGDVTPVAPPMLLKKALQKLPVRYEDELEKISMSLQSIGNLKMLSSLEFHVSESSLSKVIAAPTRNPISALSEFQVETHINR
jgi:hypothetical protein